jgi:hypothetical protein
MLRPIVFFFLVCCSLVSCQKGDTGPAGATGPQGPAGAQGPTGSANVTYSQWFTPATWVKDTVFGIYGFYYNKATTDITQQVVDSGLVLTYGKLDGYTTAIWPTSQVAQLPITITYMEGSTTYTDVWSALVTTGNLEIQFVDNMDLYGGISNAHQFRYIVIPGGMKSAVASQQPGLYYSHGKQLDPAAVSEVIQHYQDMGYAQVCQLLGIVE